MKKHYLLTSPMGNEYLAEFDINGKACVMTVDGTTVFPAPKGKERKLVYGQLTGVVEADENLFVYDGIVVTAFCKADGESVEVLCGRAESVIMRKDGRAYIRESELKSYDLDRVQQSINAADIEYRLNTAYDEQLAGADYSGEDYKLKTPPKNQEKVVALIGGGAAAMFLSGQIAVNRRLKVVVCERSSRVGKKLAQTGNGRCNLANINDDAANYSDERIARDLFSRISLHEILRKFYDLGLAIRTEENRVYPMSSSASSVIDVLRNRMRILGVQEKFSFNVVAVRPEKNGRYSVISETGDRLIADYVIFCAGSSASVNDTGMKEIFSKLALQYNPLLPSLLPLEVKQRIVPLSGVRAEAVINVTNVPKISGEIQFKDNTISGIPAFELSFFLGRLKAYPCNISIDFWEYKTEEQIYKYLEDKTRQEGLECGEILTGVFNRRICDILLDAAGITIKNADISTMSESSLRRLARIIKHFKLTVLRPTDFNRAQSVLGGLALSEVDFADMSVKKYPGMYAVGECVDFHGNCGGFNLMAVWAESLACAQAILRETGV